MMRLQMLVAWIEARPGWRVVSCRDESVLCDYPGGRIRYILEPGFEERWK